MGIHSPSKVSAARCVIATTADNYLLLIHTTPATLHDLAAALHADPPLDHRIDRALNLDGGPSAAFQARTTPAPITHQPTGPVRSFILLRPLGPPTP